MAAALPSLSSAVCAVRSSGTCASVLANLVQERQDPGEQQLGGLLVKFIRQCPVGEQVPVARVIEPLVARAGGVYRSLERVQFRLVAVRVAGGEVDLDRDARGPGLYPQRVQRDRGVQQDQAL